MSAVMWGAGGTLTRVTLQFCVQVMMARILGPEPYGIFAIGAIVVSFSGYFSDIGIAYGLIQKREILDEDVRFVVTWQLLIGSMVTFGVYQGSEQVAAFFREDASGIVVKVLAVICLLNALAAPSLNLLKRDLDFRRIQIAQSASYVVGYVLCGIPLALAGAQVWALVAAWIVQASVSLVLLYGAVRHSLRPLVWCVDARRLAAYGLTVLATNLTNWMINNVDRVIVGRIFSGRDIGLYVTSYNTLFNPTISVLGIVQPVFFSASARISEDRPRVEAAYRSLLAAVSLFMLPVFAGLSVVSGTFVVALYGPEWANAGAVLQPLALAMPFFLIWGLTTPILWTGGYLLREFLAQIPVAALWIVACWFAARHSLSAVAWTVLMLFAVRCAVIVGAAVRSLALDVWTIWRAIRGGVVVATCVSCALSVVDLAFSQSQVAPLGRLVVEIAFAAVLLALLIRLLPKVVSPDLIPLIERVAARLPAPIARSLTILFSVRERHASR